MNKEEDPDLELYGTSPGVIGFFMILISLIVPIGIVPFNAFIILGGYAPVDFMIYSLIWFYVPEYYLPFGLIPLFFLLNIWITLPLTIFNIAYIWKIIRYYRGQCTRYSVVWVGLLSIILPTLIALATMSILSPAGGWLFIEPIPLQFIVGLIFLYKIPGPEMTSPWRDDLAERSLWKPKRPEWWYRTFPSSDKAIEKQESEQENERLEYS